MADNVAVTAGSGTIIAADDVGGVMYQRVKIGVGADGSATDVSSASPMPVFPRPRYIVVSASAMTRPANTTAYAALDAVSNNATAGSVTAISLSPSDTNDDPVAIERLRILSTDTGPGTAGATFRAWLFSSDPTASSGVGGGDNAAFSQKQAGFIGTMSGTFRAFSDGSGAVLAPDEGAEIITLPSSGAKTVFVLLQTLTAFTPSANSTTFTVTIEGVQGRA